MEVCNKCGGKLVVYATRTRATYRLRYVRCKQCSKPQGKMRTEDVVAISLLELTRRVEQLESVVNELG
jgi:ssDNA-binding Zn-finger/Zn-ribbon topoisomerase 1